MAGSGPAGINTSDSVKVMVLPPKSITLFSPFVALVSTATRNSASFVTLKVAADTTPGSKKLNANTTGLYRNLINPFLPSSNKYVMYVPSLFLVTQDSKHSEKRQFIYCPIR